MAREEIIVTLTSYGPRMNNLPIVLDTIFAQTVLPNKVVLNLAFEETIPNSVNDYLNKKDVEVFRVQDTKVYKKLIPTLIRYPEACVISIDDDWLYPQGMIEDFMDIHQRYPDNPISGNRAVCYGMQCHCGCASLTKKIFFGNWLNVVDETLISNCPSDDLVYTFLAFISGHPYIRTKEEYFNNMTPFNAGEGYTETVVGNKGIEKTYLYLKEIIGGGKKDLLSGYAVDKHLLSIFEDVILQEKIDVAEQTKIEVENRIRSSYAYRLGKLLLKPFFLLKRN